MGFRFTSVIVKSKSDSVIKWLFRRGPYPWSVQFILNKLNHLCPMSVEFPKEAGARADPIAKQGVERADL